jgi:endonuclease G
MACRALVVGIGYPEYADKEKQKTTKFVCHTAFALSHNNTGKTPIWVIERLKGKELTGKFERPNIDFIPEEAVLEQERAVDADYLVPKKSKTKSLFARGHLAPSEDFNDNCALMKETFVFSNVVPQIGGTFNSSIWAGLEAQARGIAEKRGEIVVITGTVPRKDGSVRTIAKKDNDCGNEIRLDGAPQTRICAARNKNPKAACPNGVAVPLALYKIIYDPQEKTAYAYVLPNRPHTSKGGSQKDRLDGFRTTVAALERETGVVFFPELAQDARDDVVNKCTKDKPWVTIVKKAKGKVCK